MEQIPRETPQGGTRVPVESGGASRERREEMSALEQVLAFRLGGERYGIAIESIEEILKYRKATPIPRADAVVHGIISLRGRIVTVLDGRLRLGLPPAEIGSASRIIVVRTPGEPVGVLVDEVLQVMKLPVDAVKPPPATVEASDKGILGVCDTRQDSILILLDIEAFLQG